MGAVAGFDQVGEEGAGEFGDAFHAGVIQGVGLVGGAVVFGMAAGEEVQDGQFLGIEGSDIGGEVGIVLQDEAEAGGDVAFFEEASPGAGGADALKSKFVFAEAADHVEVDAGDNIGEGGDGFLGEVVGTDEADFLTGPEGEDETAAKEVGALLAFGGEGGGEFEDSGGAGGVVIRAVVDFAFVFLAGQGTHLAAAKVVVVRAD